MEPIAVYTISNTLSVNIYRIQYGIDDEVLAGQDSDRSEWCKIHYDEEHPYFYLGQMKIPLSECITAIPA